MSAPKSPACPVCAKPADQRLRPFCSKRCADVDLNRWLKGAYVIPGRTDESGGEPGGAES